MKTKSYRITRSPYYRDGVRYVPGDIVTVPAKEEPARDWVPVTAAEAKAAEAASPALVEADVKFSDDERPSDKAL